LSQGKSDSSELVTGEALMSKRFGIFKSNAGEVEEHNLKEDSLFKMEIN
jgi:hypothetical protein